VWLEDAHFWQPVLGPAAIRRLLGKIRGVGQRGDDGYLPAGKALDPMRMMRQPVPDGGY